MSGGGGLLTGGGVDGGGGVGGGDGGGGGEWILPLMEAGWLCHTLLQQL